MSTKVVSPVQYFTASENKENLAKKLKNKFVCQKTITKIIEVLAIPVLLLTGKPKILNLVSMVPSWLYALILVSLICCIICGILYFASKSIDSYNNKIYLSQIHHACTHKLRDLYVQSMNSIISKKTSPSIMEDTCNTICREIGNIFNEIKKTKNNGVAIRLAKKENNGIFYETRGRHNLDPGRERSSVAIPLTTGLPAFLNKKNQTGCLIYHDIFKAAELETFKLTANEQNSHKAEITSLMALPLNCGFGKAKTEMIGILYITSPEKAFFTVHDVDFARNLADFAAIIITQVLLEFRLYQSNLKKQKQPTSPGK